MIQANISEIKNRLSHYLRLVRGGEQVEILDRNTPLARMTHISQTDMEDSKTPWMKEVQRLGIVKPPQKRGFSPELLAKENVVLGREKNEVGTLKALLKERRTAR